MPELWLILLPLAITSAVFPVEAAITLLLLRSPGGRVKVAAWIGGKTLVRLAQFALFAGVLDVATDDGEPGTSAVEGALLLVVAVLLLVAAARKLAKAPGEDDPPPRWMTAVAGLSPARSLLAGAAIIGLNPKHWAFSLAAIGAIADAELDPMAAWAAFLVFVVVAQALHLGALAFALVAPATADRVLGRVGDALDRYSRPVMIAMSLGFGLWFLARALAAFGIL